MIVAGRRVDPLRAGKAEHAGVGSEQQVEDRAVLVVDDRAQAIGCGGLRDTA